MTAPDLFTQAGVADVTSDSVALGRVLPMSGGPLAADRTLDRNLFLGTSSWSFPGWRHIVYDRAYSAAALARQGLAAYSSHPLLRTVSLDRTFYQPIGISAYRDYAAQTSEDFRFMVKAPALICDTALRDVAARRTADNPHFLDAAIASDSFVGPCMEGLAGKAGPLVFQLPPMVPANYGSPSQFADRIAGFFAALPRATGGQVPLYALELRNSELLTPRLMKALHSVDVRLCIGIHARMPEIGRQARALAVLDGAGGDAPWQPQGPLVVRWSLHADLAYEAARAKYAPFNRLVDEDLATRRALAALARTAIAAGKPAFIIANNKAEGCAPLSMKALLDALSTGNK